MAAPVAAPVIASLVSSAVQIGSSNRSARRARRQARQLASANASMVRMETKYELANLGTIMADVMAEAEAAIGASGFSANSATFNETRESLSAEFQRQKDWLKASGAQREKVAQLGGQIQSQNISAAQASSNISAVTGAVSTIGSAMNWWQ